MTAKAEKRLKDAIQNMDKVVASLPLHAKLNRAWAEVKKAMANVRDQSISQQDELFREEGREH